MEAESLSALIFLVRLGIVTVLLWVCSRLFDLWLEARRRAADRDAFIRAIHAEVAFNTYDMKRFLDATISLDRISEIFEANSAFVPHITDARHTDIYRSRIGALHTVAGDGARGTNLVGDLVRFYGELEKVTQQIEGLSKDSFKHISVKGKAGTVGLIYKTCEICEGLGSDILRKMHRAYPHLIATDAPDFDQDRYLRRQESRADLAVRLAKLSSDLDRVNKTGHRHSP